MSTYIKYDQPVFPEQLDNCPKFLETYLHYQSVLQGVRPRTVVLYFLTLRDFFQYLRYCTEEGAPPATADVHKDIDISGMEIDRAYRVIPSDVLDYLDFLSDTVGNEDSTVSKKLISLRGFFFYLDSIASEVGLQWAQGENPIKSIQLPEVKKKPMVLLTKAQMERLILPATEFVELRDRAMLHLLITTGITTSELVALNRKDLNHQVLTVRSRNKSRTMYLTDTCAASIRAYIDWIDESIYAPDGQEVPLFVAERSCRRLTSRTVQNRITAVAAKAGLSNMNINANVLRDSCAALLIQENYESSRYSVLHYLGFSHESHGRFSHIKSKPATDFATSGMFSAVAKSSLAQIGKEK